MKAAIDSFLSQKRARANTVAAYRYDLHQFVACCEGVPLETGLARYQASLQDSALSARKRKLSVVNQFLYFLYEQGLVERYHRLAIPKGSKPVTAVQAVETAVLLEESSYPTGQLIALLIAYLGLLPAEIAQLKAGDLDREFGIVTVASGGQKRIVPLPTEILPFLPEQAAGTYLFDKKGTTYSRQWFFNHLSAYVASIGHPDWTAQSLREQYIIRSLQAGMSVDDLTHRLGLKTRLNVEKYTEWISN